MSLSRLKWYAARLAAMSAPEVAHRVREAALKQAWKGNTRGWANFDSVQDGPLADLAGLHARLAAAPKQDLILFNTGLYSGLGQTVAASDPDVWFRDPVRGGVWDRQSYCFSADVRSTGTTRGDVKFVWEINRLQGLHPLAAEVAAGREDGARLLRVVKDWAAANPPYRGVNWFSGIELAMRMVTLTLVIAALPGAEMRMEDRTLLRRMVAAHGFWLARYPSKFSSANNHLVAEGLGLLLAGLLVPDLPQASAWEAEGRHILETEAALQILADGVGTEQSPTYQAFTMEMLAFGALMAVMTGKPLAPVVRERLMAGATFLRALMDTAGLPPRIGDDDEGRVIAAPPNREPAYVASIVASVAGLLSAPELLPPGHEPHLRDVLFAVPEGRAETSPGLHSFAGGGYTVIRETMAGRAAVLTFDHGPLGYLSLAAHGHADALALWLSLDDVPVLVDAGTYLYHSGGAVRNALRSSPAHNTLTIAEASQSVPSSAFSWSIKAQGRGAVVRAGEAWAVAGSHDGYAKRFGVAHHRQISREGAGFSIEDRLEGAKAAMPVSLTFLLGPDVRVEQMDLGAFHIVHGHRVLARLVPPPGFSARIVENDRQRGMGVYSPCFAALHPVQQLVLTGKMAAEAIVTRVEIVPG